jgi:transcriptional regulator with XRE-family HTH domain
MNMAKEGFARQFRSVPKNPYLGEDVVEHLDVLIPNTPQTRRVGKQEEVRLELTDAMRQARKRAGLSQQEVARSLGVGQSWVSKLESANYDHQLESVVAHLDAVGAELLMAVKLGDELIPVTQTHRLLLDVPAFYQAEAGQAGMTLREYVYSGMEGYRLANDDATLPAYADEGYSGELHENSQQSYQQVS